MYNQQNMKVKIDNIFETICPFPIGYVYMSSDSTSPADIYGGTWTSISDGRYLRANGTWGNGGSDTITTDQMPRHRHIASRHGKMANISSGQGYTANVINTWGNDGNTDDISTQYTGGGATVLSNVSGRIRLVQSCLNRKQVIVHA